MSSSKNFWWLFCIIAAIVGSLLWAGGAFRSSIIAQLAPATRETFGPLVSPDGAWRLTVSNDNYQIKKQTHVFHRVQLQSLRGEIDDHLDELNQPIAPGREIERWQAAGWSADASKVYYVAQLRVPGLEKRKPAIGFAGDALYQIDLNAPSPGDGIPPDRSGKLVFRLNPYEQIDILNGTRQGIHDVYAAKNLMTYTKITGSPMTEELNYFDTLYVSDLTGKKSTRILSIDRTERPNDGIASATINPAGDKIYIVEYQQPSGTSTYQYSPMTYDITTGKLVKK